MYSYNPSQVEEKWRQRWEGLFDAEPDEREKFFIIFAYPGISGYLHVGHMRGYTYADIIARYRRMCNFNVLFPAGFHASGLPSVSLAKKVRRGDEETIQTLRENGCPDDVINKLSDPLEVVKYFSDIYINDYWKRFGFSIDYRRAMTTISEGYKNFIRWQFERLNERNLLIQKPHFAPLCLNCGPVAVDSSETDIVKGGGAEILEWALLCFRLKSGELLPASTLRPETIFGVTNMWINPDADYVKVQRDDFIWIVSKEAGIKLEYQKGVKVLKSLKGSELVGQRCWAPLVNREIIILPSSFVDPKIATGVVMSVPAHAPYDWVALKDINEEELKRYGISREEVKSIEPISLIKSDFESEFPGVDICKELNIESLSDVEKLEEATNIVYKREFHSGVLKENTGEYKGMKVSEVKDKLLREFIDLGIADSMYEFSEEVVCRCGSPVIIGKVPDQWFIKYSDSQLTENSKNHARNMIIKPAQYYEEMPKVLDWFSDRACIRQGDWLGTEFPFKEGWIIEPISDSTLYPAYYILSKYINSGELKPEQMDTRFFDYVFLDRETDPSVPSEILEKIKRDMNYWYPLDINLGGKEHKTVHFPVFLMNHVAVMPEKFWPKGIFVHWWVTQTKGAKISKAKGGAEPIPYATEKYSVDGMRLYYSHAGSVDSDIEWNPSTVLNYKARIERVWRLINQLIEIDGSEKRNIDRWLLSVLNKRIAKVKRFMDNYDLRASANEIFFGVYSDLRWYLKRGGSSKETVRDAIDKWIRMMAPFTPFIAEELWEITGNEGFVSLADFPKVDESKIDANAESAEEYLKALLDDINEILKVTKIEPRTIVIYTAQTWKVRVYIKALEMARSKTLEMGGLIREVMSIDDVKEHRADVPNFVKKLVSDIMRMSANEIERNLIEIDEKEYLEESKDLLESEFNCKVEIHRAGEEKYDPQGKAKLALPRRPAIYVE